MSKLDLTKLLNKGIPYKYVAGAKSEPSSGGFPVDVTISFDPELKSTLFKTAAIGATGIAIGMAVQALIKYR